MPNSPRVRYGLPVLICLAMSSGTGPLLAEETGTGTTSTTDWPTVISQLQQEVYRRPGFANVRQQLAIAHNNYGVQLSEQGQWESAAQELEEAVRLDAANASFRTNLANLYLSQAAGQRQGHEEEAALDAIDKALAVNPDLARAYVLKGDIEYGRQRLKEAKAAWEQAVQLDPSLQDVAKRLQQVTQELPVESKFDRLSQAYFDLRYEEALGRSASFDIQEALLDARRSVGADFAYWPKHRVVVLIYSSENFRKLREETPEWVAGQFDGKIRVPLPSAQLDSETVKRILHHEYTHALIHDLTSGRCPTWLNEGLAEYEGRKAAPGSSQSLAAAYRENRLVSWAQLSDQFAPSMPVADVRLGYEQAHSIAQYLAERYGFWRIRQILKELGEGRSWEEVFERAFHLKLARVEAAWREWLGDALGEGQRP